MEASTVDLDNSGHSSKTLITDIALG